MRPLLTVVLLGLIGGGLLLWLSDPGDGGDVDALSDGGGEATPTDGGTGLMTAEAEQVILVRPADGWPRDLMRDGVVFGDARALDDVEIVNPTGEEYYPTGAEVIRILEEKYAGTPYQFRFRDEATLEAFKQTRLQTKVPARAPARLLLDVCRDSGFAFVAYGGRIFVTPAKPGELPGAGHVPAPPVEGPAPDDPRGPR